MPTISTDLSTNLSTQEDSFIHNYEAGKTQLYYEWIEGDLETPVSAYLKLCPNQDNSFLLESVEGGTTLGRYSVIGFDPDLIWQHEDGKTSLTQSGEAPQTIQDDPLTALRAQIKACEITADVPNDLPPMAVSGLFGYLGYDTIRWVEDIPSKNPDTIGVPDAILIRPRALVIFDNVKNMICLVTPVYNHVDNSGISAVKALSQKRAYLSQLVDKLNDPIPDSALGQTASVLELPLQPTSNTPINDYKRAVEKTVEHIHEGEIFQGVIAQRFEVPFDLPSFALYRSLRRLNPSPFLFHLKLNGFSLIGSSPEILVRVRNETVTIRPIAGTRKRGATQQEDLALEQELLADEKERAEHLMLLDLGRNDVGKVSEYGSVKVTDSYMIERYSHVMHIVSNVEGKLAKDKDALDAFFSGFPAGTVSGAPKIRAMEIIDELEIAKRKSYAGSVGYFSGNGDIDTCIALRTGLLKDGTLYVQAGGGIVADSRADFEHQECVNKAKAVINAAQEAVARSKHN